MSENKRVCARGGRHLDKSRTYCGRTIKTDTRMSEHGWQDVNCIGCRAAYRADNGERIPLMPEGVTSW